MGTIWAGEIDLTFRKDLQFQEITEKPLLAVLY